MSIKTGSLFLVTAALMLASTPQEIGAATAPRTLTYVKYINTDGTFTYYQTGTDTYVTETLPNEWQPSWDSETLKAGAIIIRSGVYWRVSRTYLHSGYPNDDCDGDWVNFTYDVVDPIMRGGHEKWIPFSAQTATTNATTATFYYHAEASPAPSRPDAFISLRYGATTQNLTHSATGNWLAKLRYAYGTSSNANCNQTDSLSSSNPSYPQN